VATYIMEGFKNTIEAFEGDKISLENKIIQKRIAGKTIAAGIHELIKIFTIIDKITESEINSEVEAGKLILALWEKLDVKIFEPEDIFTKKMLTKVMNSNHFQAMYVEINNGPVMIEKNATVDSVMSKWKKALEVNSNINNNEEEKATKQKEADQMYEALKALDFSKAESLIEWLNNYNATITEYDLDNHIEAIQNKFAQHGHYPEHNDSFDFTIGEALKDKDRYCNALIGYMLDNLGVFDSDQMREWISDWKKTLAQE
jgi:hypothetical protein